MGRKIEGIITGIMGEWVAVTSLSSMPIVVRAVKIITCYLFIMVEWVDQQ